MVYILDIDYFFAKFQHKFLRTLLCQKHRWYFFWLPTWRHSVWLWNSLPYYQGFHNLNRMCANNQSSILNCFFVWFQQCIHMGIPLCIIRRDRFIKTSNRSPLISSTFMTFPVSGLLTEISFSLFTIIFWLQEIL